MNKQKPFDTKYKSIQEETDDDEQIQRTLNFFDAVLDPYLSDEDRTDQQAKLTNTRLTQQKKHGSNNVLSTATNISSPSHPHPRYQPIKSTASTPQVRRYTSENNLTQIASPSKPVALKQTTSLATPFRTTAVSTDDLSAVHLWKNFSPQTRFSVLTDRTNGTSASLIDLTAIDKVPSRPRFRFIPPSNNNLILDEQPEIERQRRQRANPKYDQLPTKPIPSNRISSNNQPKYSHQIVKPTVIIPPKPKSAPINRLAESNIHHQNGNSAFKPPRSSAAPRVQPVPNSKRPESIQKPNVHVGITNSNNHVSNTDFLHRPQQVKPQFHQSMMNLSSIGVPETGKTNVHGSRIVYPSPPSSNFIRPVQSNKPARYYQYPPPPAVFEDSASRYMQQTNNRNNSNGIVYSSYNQPYSNGGGGGGNRSLPQSYPYGSYMSTSSGLSQPINSYDHHRHQQPYTNPTNMYKYHPSQYSTSAQSIYPTPVTTSKPGVYPSTPSNIYHFNQQNSSRDRQSKRNSYYQNNHVTTYL